MSLLEITGLDAYYGDFQALFGVRLEVATGETLAVIGANGAGKTTLLRAISGLIKVGSGCIHLDGTPIGSWRPDRIVARGVAMVPEGRKLFPSLTVEENLLMGAYCRRPGPWTLPRVYALFPALAERRRAAALTLSGGQQQMAAIGRALLANPRLLLCDEISLGLAPIVVQGIYGALPGIRAEGTALVVVEQDINRALGIADRVYCLQEGRVSLEGPPSGFDREAIRLAYFGR